MDWQAFIKDKLYDFSNTIKKEKESDPRFKCVFDEDNLQVILYIAKEQLPRRHLTMMNSSYFFSIVAGGEPNTLIITKKIEKKVPTIERWNIPIESIEFWMKNKSPKSSKYSSLKILTEQFIGEVTEE